MFIKDLYAQKKPVMSFEIFPPKQTYDTEKLHTAIDALKLLSPDFISITYGAGGSDSAEKTLDVADVVKNKYGIETMAHLTCVSATKESIKSVLDNLKKHNIENVLALRGDMPLDAPRRAQNTDYSFAKDLIPDIKAQGFGVGAAAYPEGHIECDDFDLSISHLKEKADAGADFFITQLFFDNNIFYNFANAAAKKNINVPLVPGVMPILSTSQVTRMIFMCGTSLPAKIIKILNKYESDPVSLKQAGIDYSYEQMSDLIKNGADGIHIYTMNTPQIARSNMERLKQASLI